MAPVPRLATLVLPLALAACRPAAQPIAPVRPPPTLAAPTTPPPAAPPILAPPATSPSGQVAVHGRGAPLPPALADARARGLEAMDAGRFDLARQAFAEVLDGSPGNLATQALHDAATAAMLAAQQDSAAAFANLSPIVVAAPPWDHTVRRPVPVPALPAPKLVLAGQARNAIIDHEDWFTRNQLTLPEYEVPNPMRNQPGTLPPSIPPTFGKFLLVQAIRQDPYDILFYGADYSGGRFVAVQRAGSGELVTFLDFAAWEFAPEVAPGERMFVDQRAIWAAIDGGVLYLAFGHSTYARSSRGRNAYLSALDLATGELLWRSAPLVANASTFVLLPGHIVTGYGFTDEPDHLFVLDRATGKTLSKVKLKSGPSYILPRDGRLHVRCYDQDYVFTLQ